MQEIGGKVFPDEFDRVDEITGDSKFPVYDEESGTVGYATPLQFNEHFETDTARAEQAAAEAAASAVKSEMAHRLSAAAAVLAGQAQGAAEDARDAAAASASSARTDAEQIEYLLRGGQPGQVLMRNEEGELEWATPYAILK